MNDDRRWGQNPLEPSEYERTKNQVDSSRYHANEDSGNKNDVSSENVFRKADAQPGNTQNEGNTVPPRYAHYQITQKPEKELQIGTEKPRKKNKNKRGSKFGRTISLAVVFGLVAGVVFQGVNYAFDFYLDKDNSSNTSVSMMDDTQLSLAETEGSASQEGTVAGVAEAAMPTVVAITSVSIQEIPSYFSRFGFGAYGIQEYPSTGSGSGIIVGENDDELLIATNNHVVEDATTLSVCFIGNDVVNAEEETQNLASGDGDINVEDAVSAKIKGTDADNDLAVVAVQKDDIPEDTMEQIKIAKIGNSDNLVVGEQVVAIGNALGYGQSVTSGWVSALNRSVVLDSGTSAELIQTDAAINPGNSGGALLNMKGEVIGINSAKYASDTVEGMGYAIPISKAKPILEELMNRVTRDKVDESDAGYLGLTPADLTTEAIQMYNMPAGVFVIEVKDGMAAQNAGIQKGDIITKLDGQSVTSEKDLSDKLSYYAAGEQVEVVIARAEQGVYTEQTLEVVLSSASDIRN